MAEGETLPARTYRIPLVFSGGKYVALISAMSWDLMLCPDMLATFELGLRSTHENWSRILKIHNGHWIQCQPSSNLTTQLHYAFLHGRLTRTAHGHSVSPVLQPVPFGEGLGNSWSSSSAVYEWLRQQDSAEYLRKNFCIKQKSFKTQRTNLQYYRKLIFIMLCYRKRPARNFPV